MSYYLRVFLNPNGQNKQVWKIENDTAERIDVSNTENGPGTFFRANPGETIWDALSRQTHWLTEFHPLKLQPGVYYRRMARPIDHHPSQRLGWNPGIHEEADFVANAEGQLTALARQLGRICQTVQPEEETFKTFGHDIRNLLILACTEVESHWRGVLVKNGETKEHLNTRNYVPLREAMRLDEYAVAFPDYPWLVPFKPFEGWTTASPTSTLRWYDANNAVKHNRELKFKQATLRHTFEAVAACAIMMAAQFGLHLDGGWRSELQSFFLFSAVPEWPFSDVYISPYGVGGWSAVPFDFSGHSGTIGP